MITAYTDHAANERTFLAWVRTGIAVIAFGFVVEKFNLFVLAIAASTVPETAQRLHLSRLSGPMGRYDGLALVLAGLIIIMIATARYVRTGRLIDDQQVHAAGNARTEVVLAAALIVFIGAVGVFLVLG
jgi:putative membrane protein